MIKRLLVLSLSVWCFQNTFGQTVIATQEILQGYKTIPQEEIFVHHNTDLLLAGEYLYYKVYCKNRATKEMSSLSKVAYVELVGEDKTTVFRHKVRLNNGMAQGDFFLPVGVSSGSYKLIAYTQWMRNAGEGAFFESDIAIINPYRSSQGNILTSSENSAAAIAPYDNNITPINPNNGAIQLKTDKLSYDKREKVRLQVSTGDYDVKAGSYSLSVRKLDAVVPFSEKSSQNYIDKQTTKSLSIGSSMFLPELRGEVVWGTITSKANGSPAGNAKVALSIPGQDFVTKIANTNPEGIFYFVLQDEFNDENATFQVLGDTASDYEIVVSKHAPLAYDDLEFKGFTITKDLEDIILKRSVYNQIENGYYELKPDTIKLPLASPPFYGKRGRAYNLDDYKRFNTVKETFLEFIDDAWTKNVGGETVFSVRAYENTLVSDFPPLIIVDGIVVQDQQKLLDYPARKIKTVSIVRDKYFLGAEVFQGVIIIETLTGDFYESLTEDYVAKIGLFTTQPKKSYFSQSYMDYGGNRMPDFRSQLLWEPNAEVNESNGVWEFYTSDNTGTYEVSLEGFTGNGVPVSLKKFISVK
ncbi:hypothetical protein POV27_11855 [Aureisphaera galaxeae]|uniref:hypothetical protein n=1 Tax=Aureisphaera galaxeae TaxID=1538023 RepID=UPI00234FC5FC|nr:hypothetical protein [Aureisphaera galaxeae]MDC8004748.1 hypothetical protein [Aureisphaera galaxeae]